MPLTREALFLALRYLFGVFYLKYSRASQFPFLVTVADLGVATIILVGRILPGFV